MSDIAPFSCSNRIAIITSLLQSITCISVIDPIYFHIVLYTICPSFSLEVNTRVLTAEVLSQQLWSMKQIQYLLFKAKTKIVLQNWVTSKSSHAIGHCYTTLAYHFLLS